jgi:hypothetical protein
MHRRGIPHRPQTRENVHKYINQIKKYADNDKPNRKNCWGDTALHKSVRLEYYELAKYFLKCGTDVNAKGLNDDTVPHYSYKYDKII